MRRYNKTPVPIKGLKLVFIERFAGRDDWFERPKITSTPVGLASLRLLPAHSHPVLAFSPSGRVTSLTLPDAMERH
ncbi:hypothetical protein [Paracoccus sp. (in: a-proteobacteria)]|uniref:hypothetical protein n=1 Tax=Paracoccus sp. TaxID=267 RepID=UPI00396CB78E